MLSYTSEDEIRKYFDTDETLSPENWDSVPSSHLYPEDVDWEDFDYDY